MKIGEKIMLRRKQLNLTQEELARRMGYKSKSTINKIELGINDIPQSKVVKFADVLHTDISYLMDWDEPTEKPVQEDELSENVKKLVDFAKSVPDDKVDMILRVMKSIVESD